MQEIVEIIEGKLAEAEKDIERHQHAIKYHKEGVKDAQADLEQAQDRKRQLSLAMEAIQFLQKEQEKKD